MPGGSIVRHTSVRASEEWCGAECGSLEVQWPASTAESAQRFLRLIGLKFWRLQGPLSPESDGGPESPVLPRTLPPVTLIFWLIFVVVVLRLSLFSQHECSSVTMHLSWLHPVFAAFSRVSPSGFQSSARDDAVVKWSTAVVPLMSMWHPFDVVIPGTCAGSLDGMECLHEWFGVGWLQ